MTNVTDFPKGLQSTAKSFHPCIKLHYQANFGSYDIDSDINTLISGYGNDEKRTAPDEWLKLLKKQQVGFICLDLTSVI